MKQQLPKYVYLDSASHVDTWVNGGLLPIKLASSYLDTERRRERTPDETRVWIANRPEDEVRTVLGGFVVLGERLRNVAIVDCSSGGQQIPDVYIKEARREDGLVLCFSNVLSYEIAQRLGRCFCVAVDDIDSLKASLDRQIGAISSPGNCSYVKDHYRTPFIKGHLDGWQREYRLYWPNAAGPVKVRLDAGVARPAYIPARPINRRFVVRGPTTASRRFALRQA